jgi:hypothetical protein
MPQALHVLHELRHMARKHITHMLHAQTKHATLHTAHKLSPTNVLVGSKNIFFLHYFDNHQQGAVG